MKDCYVFAAHCYDLASNLCSAKSIQHCKGSARGKAA